MNNKTKELKKFPLPLVIVTIVLLITAKVSNMYYAFDLIVHSIIASVMSSHISSSITRYISTKNKKHLIEAGIYLAFAVSSTWSIIALLLR